MVHSEVAHAQFFPEPDDPELVPFTRAIMHMMFAHVELERRIAELADVITLDLGFGETEALVWSAKARPAEFKKLCAANQGKHPGGLPEGVAIAGCLNRAIPHCHDRNWLTHGVWWQLDRKSGVLDVHAVRIRKDEPLNREFTVDQILQLAGSLKDVEVELWRLQSEIEGRSSIEICAEPLFPSY